MGFDGLLGNERLKDNLINSLRRDRTSHFYLISGPQGSGKHTLAQLLAAALMCTGEDKPCLRCRACRKVMDGLHPDVITVTEPDHKTVPVRLVRQIRDDMFIRPNEGRKKIYLFPQELGLEGQNALLKILEEPPEYGVYLLLTEQAETLLPTVRSRAVSLQLQPLSHPQLHAALNQAFPDASQTRISAAIMRSGGYLGQACALLKSQEDVLPQTAAFAHAFADRDSLAWMQLLVSMEKSKREQLAQVLQQWLQLLEDALICRSGLQATWELSEKLATRRSGPELQAAVMQLKKCMDYARGNVSVAAICGYLLWQL